MMATPRRAQVDPDGPYVGIVEVVKHTGGVALSMVSMRFAGGGDKSGNLIRPSTRYSPRNLAEFVKGKPIGWRGPALLDKRSPRESYVYGVTPDLRSAVEREEELRRTIRADVDKLFERLPPV